MYYRNANCAVVVYDITQSASLEKARNWIRELQRQADPSIVIALCGNKSDLAARRQVTQEEAQKYAEEEGLMWAETSAKSGEGVSDIFTAIGTSTITASRHFDRCSRSWPTVHSEEAPNNCTSGVKNGSCGKSRPCRKGGRRPQQAARRGRQRRRVQLLEGRFDLMASTPFASMDPFFASYWLALDRLVISPVLASPCFLLFCSLRSFLLHIPVIYQFFIHVAPRLSSVTCIYVDFV